ncbi:Bacteriophytochrome cph2 [Edwardsiella tarda]|nr:Bacteriophytochrome cph2 [Edwardsiella tarda]
MNDPDPSPTHAIPPVSTASPTGDDEVYRAILRMGLANLHMQLGVISRVSNNIASVLYCYPVSAAFPPGSRLSLSTDFSRRVMDEDRLVVYVDPPAEAVQPLPAAYRAQPLGCYIGVPLWLGEERYGLLELLSTQAPSAPFSEEQLADVALLARSIGYLLHQARLRQANQQLIRENQRINTVIEKAFKYAAIGMALVAPGGYFRRANRTFCKMLGYSETEMRSICFQSITHPDDLALDLQNLEALAQRHIDFYTVEKRYLMKAGTYLWVRLSVSAIYDEEAVLFYISQIQDIQAERTALRELAAQREQLERLNQALTLQANIDYLTGIRNRRSLIQQFAAMLAQSGSLVALALFDLDYFKHYNDTYGHQAGDEALVYFADALRHHFREPESLIGRFGGEEFIVLCSAEHACGALARLDTLRETLDYGSDKALQGHLTVSIGCVLLPRQSVTPNDFDALVHHADEMLYQAKNSGRNRLKHRELKTL